MTVCNGRLCTYLDVDIFFTRSKSNLSVERLEFRSSLNNLPYTVFFCSVKTKRQANFKDFQPLEPMGGSSNKKTLYSTRSCVMCAFLALVNL
jgi:hypothetical protein